MHIHSQTGVERGLGRSTDCALCQRNRLFITGIVAQIALCGPPVFYWMLLDASREKKEGKERKEKEKTGKQEKRTPWPCFGNYGFKLTGF